MLVSPIGEFLALAGLGLCLVLVAAVTVERAVRLRRRHVLPPEFVENIRALAAEKPPDHEKILTYCLAHPNPVSRIVMAAVKRAGRPLPEIEAAVEDAGAKEVRLLRHNCRVLSGVFYVAPLLGLLGTVIGLTRCFIGFSEVDAADRGMFLAGAASHAVQATSAGLAVAIPALIIYMVLSARIEKLVMQLDNLALELVDVFSEPEA
jgi:biopolymer transport protein ExbB